MVHAYIYSFAISCGDAHMCIQYTPDTFLSLSLYALRTRLKSISTYPRMLQYSTLCSHVDINHVADITHYLHSLDRTAVINLGLVLGLDYNRLRPMMDTPTFLQDMLTGWLQRVDRVLMTGVPTWWRLVEALRDPRVGQNELAHEIEQNNQQ